MEQQLYPHNQAAYEKVMKAFETDNKTCICHPTGTGKSYIVAAVCKNFKNILILAPNIFVLNQQKEVIGEDEKIQYMTYPGLLKKVWDIETKFDLIILDEFHRAGSSEWGAAVNLLLESQKEAKILGTSATYIRYLDGEKDMAKELFEGKIASEMTIADAWNQNILPIPTYVTGFFSFDKIIANATERINNSSLISTEEKRQRIFRLNNMKLDWEKSSGMVSILKKHITDDTKRIIVFCAHIEELKEMSRLIKQWFKKAGHSVSGIYILHSKQTDVEQLKQMHKFSLDNSKGIKIMLSVNILNEGVHIPNVNAVIMLRTTSSPIIYTQQLGRCLTTSKAENTIVLDMVDNITTATTVSTALNELKKEVFINNLEKSEPKSFKIFDYTLDVHEMIDKLTRQRDPYSFETFEERIKVVKEFCEKYRRLPTKRTEGKAYAHYQWLFRYYPNHPEFIALKNKYKINRSIEDRLKQLYKFIENNNTLPRQWDGDDYINWSRIIDFKKKCRNNDTINTINKIKEKYSIIKTDNRVKEELRKFIEKHNRLPSASRDVSKKELYLRASIIQRKLHETDSEVKKLWTTYRTRNPRLSSEEKIINMQKFIEEHKRHPHKNEPEYPQWTSILFHCKNDERVVKMKKEYGRKYQLHRKTNHL